MKYELLGSAAGRSVYLFTYHDDSPDPAPGGFSAGALILQPDWKADDVLWTLNALYGSIADWTDFDSSAGVRSFSFYGERADDASALCDALAYAWSAGSDAEYENIMASSHDEATLEQFVDNLLTGEILAGERYADSLQNVVFAVNSPQQAKQVSSTVGDAIARATAQTP